MENETQEQKLTSRNSLRRAAPIVAALALGGGVGAGVYAGVNGGSSGEHATTVIASVPAQSAATTATTTLTQLYKKAAPGVVDIVVTTSGSTGGFGGPTDPPNQAEGVGFVFDQSGDIITNAHVVDGATAIKVRFQNGKVVNATLVGKDESTDIAVIKVNVPSAQLTPLSIGTSSSLQVGQTVAAIGSPFGLPETMTAGIISALDRTIT